MSENPRVFGVVEDAYPDVTADPTSPLDDLRAELAAPVRRETTARYEIDGRPGWWAEFDTAIRAATIERISKVAARGRKAGDPDPLKMALLVIAETCTAIGKGDTIVFAEVDGPAGPLPPFKSGEIPAAIGGAPDWQAARATTSEAEWATAIRWLLGALDDDGPVLRLAAAAQSDGATEVTRADGDPTS